MTTQCLRIYVHEGLRKDGHSIHDWLFDAAGGVGLAGGIAFRASAGFGRHGLVEDSFFELAGDLPQVVEFLADESRIRALLEKIGRAGLELVYSVHEVSLGVTGR